MKSFSKKVLSLFLIIGLLMFFGVYTVVQYQDNYLTGYLGIDFQDTQAVDDSSTNQEDTSATDDDTDDDTVELTNEDREFFEDNKVQCLDTTPSSFTVCKFYMPFEKRLANDTMQIKTGNNKNPNPSAYCQQDMYNTVMCGYVQTPPKKGTFTIELKIGDEYIETNNTMKVLLPNDFRNKYRTNQGPQFTLQYSGGYIDNLNDLTSSRCQLYFEDIRSTNPMCYKLTILRELNIFTGQKRNEDRLPYANLKSPVTRAEFFTLAQRFLKQVEFISEKGRPSLLKQFTDIDTKDVAKKANHWWMEPTSYLIEQGIIKGYQDGSLKPHAKISEAEIAKVLSSIKGYSFEAEEGEQWYDPVVDFYQYRGFRINPSKAATRELAAELLHFSLGL